MRGSTRIGIAILSLLLVAPLTVLAESVESSPPPSSEQPVIAPARGGFHILWKPLDLKAPRSWWGRYLSALGGLKITAFQGWAQVASTIRDEEGRSRKVASGDAQTNGYRVSLYSAPRSTGFFLYPTADFLAQHIDIADFREAVPLIDLAGTDDIPAIITDPETGEAVDISDPNAYRLYLRSLGLGQRAGFDFVAGASWIELYFTAEAGVNLLEIRHAIVRLGDHVERGSDPRALGSYVGAGRFGLTFPTIHTAIGVTGEIKTYPQFKYPKPVEFRGPVTYDERKEINERPREFVRGAALDTAEVTVSVSYVF